MWGRSRRFWPLLAGFLFLSAASLSPCFSESIDPDQVEAWAEGRSQEELKFKLIWFAGIFNQLDSLYQEDKTDWTSTETDLRREIGDAKNSLTKLETDFTRLQTMHEEKRTQIDRERKTWRVLALGAFGAGAGIAVDRTAGISAGAIPGLIVGTLVGVIWGAVE